MAKIQSEQQALDKATLHLIFPEYQTSDEINSIARRLMAQFLVMEIYRIVYKKVDVNTKEREEIAPEIGVKEKALRDWLESDTGIEIPHLVSLVKYYVKVRKLLPQ